MLAGRDVHPRHADHLVVAAHRLAGSDGAHRQLVARRHQAGDGDAFAVDARAAEQLHARDDHIVRRMDADHRRCHDGHGRAQLSISAGSQACTVCCCSPRPSMPRRITSPGFRYTGFGFAPMPTPGGVPVVMQSPGSSVMKRLR